MSYRHLGLAQPREELLTSPALTEARRQMSYAPGTEKAVATRIPATSPTVPQTTDDTAPTNAVDYIPWVIGGSAVLIAASVGWWSWKRRGEK